ncbi:hypothetical protein TNCV_695751 [Trichonephila clavipes]|nr:hypothetical protein TNCV_695751 [Trichonephila clavipes]
MAPHSPRKSAPVEYTTDEEDMVFNDVEEDEFEKKHVDGFVMPEFIGKNPHGYARAHIWLLRQKTPHSLTHSHSNNLEQGKLGQGRKSVASRVERYETSGDIVAQEKMPNLVRLLNVLLRHGTVLLKCRVWCVLQQGENSSLPNLCDVVVCSQTALMCTRGII